MKQRIIQSLYYYYWLIRTWHLRKDFPKYKIMSIEETIDIIVTHQKSISRLGDADFLLLLEERDVSYQILTPEIAQKLKEVLACRDSRFLIGLPDTINTQKKLSRGAKVHWKMFINNHGKRLKVFFDQNYHYGNSNMTRVYIDYADKTKSFKIFEKLKTIWQSKEVVIIEGEFTRLGVGNDLLDNAKSIKRIIAPHKNAFKKYTELKEYLLRFPKENTLFLFSLGPTATILCHELSQKDYWAVDIGNIDLEYMWMKMGATEKISVPGRYSVETEAQKQTLELSTEDQKKYLNSIIYTIPS